MFDFHIITAPPQHVHSQLPVFVSNLILINFSYKAQQNRGRTELGLLGVAAGSNIVRELLTISIPQCHIQTIISICSEKGHGVNAGRNAFGRNIVQQ